METNTLNTTVGEIPSVEAKAQLKRSAAGIGWRYAVFAIVVIAVQLIIQRVLLAVVPDWVANNMSLFSFLLIILSVDLIGFPLLFLLSGKMPVVKIEKHKMGFGRFLVCVLIGAGICLTGAIVGNIIHFALTLPFGMNMDSVNGLGMLMLQSDAPIRILTVGILAPVFEELIFRKLLIDRVVKHGELAAILMSGIMFGLFHGNFAQFFFATGLGMFFAFIYIRTGRVWYTILFHMIINLSSSVITVYLSQMYLNALSDINMLMSQEEMTRKTMEALPAMLLYLGWLGILAGCGIAGIVILIVKRKKFCLNEQGNTMSKGDMAKAALFNGGMALYYIPCIALFLMTYVPTIITFLINR
ncbi:MAG: lysostaphin resistance A-like protein [Acetatifactor sp.]